MEQINKMIDHTLLKAEARKEDVKRLCQEAIEYEFGAVCIHPYYLEYAKGLLEGSQVKLCTVVGFPLGTNGLETKAFETDRAIEKGAEEIDMVMNIGALKDKNYDKVRKDIEAVVRAAKNRAIVKVIIETNLLTDEEKIKACEIVVEAGADFVKTSTGFSGGGATVEDVKLMKSTVGDKIGVKAAGGIRDYRTAQAMVEAGATRLGTSAGVSIVKSI